MNVWDIGGARKIRPYWRNYFENTDVLVSYFSYSNTVTKYFKNDTYVTLFSLMLYRNYCIGSLFEYVTDFSSIYFII